MSGVGGAVEVARRRSAAARTASAPVDKVSVRHVVEDDANASKDAVPVTPPAPGSATVCAAALGYTHFVALSAANVLGAAPLGVVPLPPHELSPTANAASPKDGTRLSEREKRMRRW